MLCQPCARERELEWSMLGAGSGRKASSKSMHPPDTNTISYLQHSTGKTCFGTDSRNVLPTRFCALPRLLSLKLNVVLSDTDILELCNVWDEQKLMKESTTNKLPHNQTPNSVKHCLIMPGASCRDPFEKYGDIR